MQRRKLQPVWDVLFIGGRKNKSEPSWVRLCQRKGPLRGLPGEQAGAGGSSQTGRTLEHLSVQLWGGLPHSAESALEPKSSSAVLSAWTKVGVLHWVNSKFPQLLMAHHSGEQTPLAHFTSHHTAASLDGCHQLLCM